MVLLQKQVLLQKLVLDIRLQRSLSMKLLVRRSDALHEVFVQESSESRANDDIDYDDVVVMMMLIRE